ncbi:murein hydrolase activator EnvC family protein [Mycoplasma sp. P36-A1]|uniref:murein hydrolase activator EnvC family protein n=1 Tax=Mycoplasma sp. P36-A1 TaxID=3252900 RepID=UPI003C2E5AE1
MNKIFKLKFLIICIVTILTSANIDATIDFKKNFDFYEETCSKRSSYELNRQACTDFERYKADNNGQVDQLNKETNDSSLTAGELSDLIKRNDELITKKEKQLKAAKVKVAKNKAKIKKLDKVVGQSIALMQHFTNENQIVDIIMGSTDLDDLMTRVDGLSAIQKINMQDVITLEQTTLELEETTQYLSSDLDRLKDIKEKQKKLNLEFQRKEVTLYTSSNSGGSATYNTALNNIDLSKINDKSKSWAKPTKSATISASTWYYPGGGWHPGADFATPIGSKITAPSNGVILAKANGGSGYGIHMVAAFKKGDYVYTMLFAHMSSFVNVNQFKKGETIGISGNTGASTGPHIHIEVFRHNTDDLSIVVKQFKQNNDYWFGLGYNNKGDCSKVCRLEPASVFNVKTGQKY